MHVELQKSSASKRRTNVDAPGFGDGRTASRVNSEHLSTGSISKMSERALCPSQTDLGDSEANVATFHSISQSNRKIQRSEYGEVLRAQCAGGGRPK